MRPLLLPLFLLSACITLDALLPFHKGIPCTEIEASDCNVDDPWDAICDACESYDQGPWWTRDYPWREKTLGSLSAIRAIETDIQHIPFETRDGRYTLDAWYLPSHGEVAELADTLVVFNHGRFAGIEHYAPRVRYFHELGYGVYVWDYRGYGHSLPVDPTEEAGPPATADWMDDAHLAFEQASSVAPDGNKIIAYGMSVGGMPAGEMADVFEAEICANIFEASYNSISAKVETNISLSMPGSHLTSGLIENEIKLADTTTPTLILHGDSDDRIHIDEAKRLFDALPEDLPKQWVVVEDAGHGLGGSGGIPEQGLENFGEILGGFLSGQAPGCLSD